MAETAHQEPDVGVTRPRITYVIARLERAVRQGINERVRQYGLTTLQYTTLSVLGTSRQLSNAQLARRSYMTPQAMSEVLEVLEARGLIERGLHPNHRRVIPVALTRKGKRVLAACDAVVRELEEEMLRELPPADRQCLYEGLVASVRALGAGFRQVS